MELGIVWAVLIAIVAFGAGCWFYRWKMKSEAGRAQLEKWAEEANAAGKAASDKFKANP